jgi:hypothetical protein
MCFEWNKQSIEWFLDASIYTEFHKELGQHIIPFLDPEDSICDFGCGLGRLDLELLPHVSRITAIDIDRQVINMLRQASNVLGYRNLYPLWGDSYSICDKHDVGIMSFFGKSGHDMLHYRNMCNKKLIRIVNVQNSSNLYPQKYRTTRKDTVSIVKNELISRNLIFDFVETSIEFGQPLRSQNIAKKFILSHAPQAPIHEVKSFLAEHAILTGREDFPIYIPNSKKVGIFVIY